MQPSIKLTKADLSYLESYKNSGKLSLRQYNRVNILFLLNKGKKNTEVEDFLNVDRITIWRTKKKFLKDGIANALEEDARSGQPIKYATDGASRLRLAASKTDIQKAMTYTKLYFNSKDGLKITADFYKIDKQKGLILLCHRSHCNRGEYRDTAPKLNNIGYSCLAIDQRSGMKIWGEINETKNRAKQKGLPTGYLDAKPDIEAAIDFAYELNNRQKIILFGSSYSASLALLISTETDNIKATIAFSPGEYLKGINLADKLKAIDKPTFVTSPKKEIQQVKAVTKSVNSKLIDHFIPTVDGFHGSKTLWESVEGHETYWAALKKFLTKVK